VIVMLSKIFDDKQINTTIKEAVGSSVYHVVIDDSYKIPCYSDREYSIIANQGINRIVLLPRSRQYSESEFMLSRVTDLSRSMDQRIGFSRGTRWNNLVRIYNFFADELGYDKITAENSQKSKQKSIRMWDEKTGSGTRTENMVYMSDGVWIDEKDCWW